MAYTIGAKMAIDGEKEFKDAVSSVNTNLRVLASEMKKVTTEYGDNSGSIEALTAKQSTLNKQVDTQKNKISALKAALANAESQYGENDKKTQQWRISLNNAETDLLKLNKEVGNNEKALKDAEDPTKKSIKDLKDMGNESEKSGSKMSNFGATVRKIAAGIGASIAAMGAAMVKMGKELYQAVNDAAAAGDDIDKLSQRLGLSREAYQEWSYVLSQSGVDIQSMQVGLKTMTNAIDDARNGSSKATGEFSRLGISIQDLEGKSREEIFAMTIKGLQGLTDDTEKAALANDLFGRSGQEIIPLLNISAEQTQELISKTHELGMIMSDSAVTASVNYTDAMDTLKTTFTGVKNTIMADLMPGFTTVMYGLSELITGQEGATEKIQSGMTEIVAHMSGVISSISGVLINLVIAVAKIAPEIIVALVNGITENLGEIIQAANDIIQTLLESILTSLPAITSGAVDLVLTLVNGILENLPMIIDAAIQTVITLAQGITEALPQLIPAVIDAVLMIVDTLINNLPELVRAALKMILALAKGLVNAIPQLIDAIPVIIESLIQAITEMLPEIILMGITLTIELGAGLIKAIPQLVRNIPKIVMAIIDGVAKGIASIKDVGGNMVKGLWQGIESSITWLWDKLVGFGDSVVSWFQDIFNINSPSVRIEQEVGLDIGRGAGVGTIKGFKEKIENIGREITGSIPLDLNIPFSASGTQANQSAGSTVHVHIGTLVADDYGLKKLERALKGIRVQENIRLGGATT